MVKICTQTYGLSREFDDDLTGTVEVLQRIGFCKNRAVHCVSGECLKRLDA